MFKRKKKRPSFIFRIFRSIFAVLVLTALVLGVSLVAKEIYNLDELEFANMTSPIAGRLGISESKTGEVAGEFVDRISKTGVSKDSDAQETPLLSDEDSSKNTSDSNNKTVKAKVAIMSDSEDSFENLKFALEKAKKLEAEYVFVLGDLTGYGDIESLKEAKKILDESKLSYSAIPGDHDIAESNVKANGGYGLENFKQVFGQTYQIVVINGSSFLLMDNSPNKTPLDETRFQWFLVNAKNADYVLLSQPLYHPAPTDLMSVMGIYKGEEVKGLHDQALIMLSEVRQSKIKAVIAGDHHMSSVNLDPDRPELKHAVIGALSKDRNIQRPRFSMLSIYEDDTYKIEDVSL